MPRQVAQTISAGFPGSVENAIQVVSAHPVAATGALSGYAARLSRLGDVASVTTVTGSYADGKQVAAGGAICPGAAAGLPGQRCPRLASRA